VTIPYNDIDALKKAINKNTIGYLSNLSKVRLVSTFLLQAT